MRMLSSCDRELKNFLNGSTKNQVQWKIGRRSWIDIFPKICKWPICTWKHAWHPKSLGKYISKPLRDTTSYLSGWLYYFSLKTPKQTKIFKTLKLINVWRNWKPLCTGGRNVKMAQLLQRKVWQSLEKLKRIIHQFYS